MAGMARTWKLVASTMLTLTSLISPAFCTKSPSNNPADELGLLINQNRTMSRLPTLYDNPGLACIALEYIQAYQGQCNKVGPNGEKPADYDFKQVFAESCGVDPATVSTITGIVLACELKYQHASYAFSSLLFPNSQTLATLQNTLHREFGVGISGYDGGPPYFWCALFSAGDPKSTFSFANGKAKYQKRGCFSGTGEPCSGAKIPTEFPVSLILASIIGAVFLSPSIF